MNKGQPWTSSELNHVCEMCFQKGASYSVIRIFNSLPQNITNLKNEKTQF